MKQIENVVVKQLKMTYCPPSITTWWSQSISDHDKKGKCDMILTIKGVNLHNVADGKSLDFKTVA